MTACPGTPFAVARPPDPHTASFTDRWYHGDGLWAGLAPPYGGRWFAGEPAMKVLWYREAPGELRIVGRRLDAPGGNLSAHIPFGYGPSGYQSTAILISEPGCWEIVGAAGGSTLRITAEVLPAEMSPFGSPSTA